MNPINSNLTLQIEHWTSSTHKLGNFSGSKKRSQVPSSSNTQLTKVLHMRNEWSHNPSIKTSSQQIQNFSLQNEHGHPSSTHTKTCKILTLWEKQPKSSLRWCIKRDSCLSHRRALSSTVWQERNLNTQLKPKWSSISNSFADCACVRRRKTGWLAIRVRKRALACRDPSLTPHWALRKIRKRPKPFRFARKPVSCPLGWCCAVPSKQICERPRMSATWTPTWIESYIFFWMNVVECISALDENKGIWLCHKRLLKWHFK